MLERKKRFTPKRIVLISILVIILFLLIFSLTIKEDKKLNKFESLIKDFTNTVEKVIFMPFNYVIDKIEEFNELRNIREKYKKLKEKSDKIEAINAENEALRTEIKELKKELNIEFVLTDYSLLNASVISRNSSYWYNTLTIDKGSYNDLKEGMVVVNGSGLIGKIVKVGTFTSEVKLITTSDTNNKISISINNGSTKVNGLIKEYNYKKKVLEVEGISNTETVNVGDLVYTSGLGGVFPSGILVGEVKSITTDEYDLAKIINVTPSAEFDNINYVSILKRKDSEYAY